MKEILFKAKTRYNPDWINIQEGIWLEGNLRQDNDMETAYINGFNYYTADFALQREEFEYQVDPETISEYIGLPDKNGRKIFKHDIVKDSHGFIGIVKFGTGNFDNGIYKFHGYYIEELGKEPIDQDMNIWDWEDVEVIGNIFDNPELLKTK